MQIEVYRMTAEEDTLTITLEAVCDIFSSLLWDIEYYKCGSFEVYIAANPQNIEIVQTGRIVGRDDDNQHFGIIESVLIDTDIENGDYLTVRGRFLMCLLERRIVHPMYSTPPASPSTCWVIPSATPRRRMLWSSTPSAAAARRSWRVSR